MRILALSIKLSCEFYTCKAQLSYAAVSFRAERNFAGSLNKCKHRARDDDNY